ncbi:hypothetical protein ASG40_17725 [Methylobacterium sp. Leaf399]|uniref:DUF3489 domain-containing protein n=1 Tax=Methylobacterium sp. Leaf399 TaxID=1736364 RepID=UPI0006F4BCE5|nr:DUF3489 domain-containing protein [Methylobacterium sp. Leaf399]KQT17221.1 hypothetical protein ASG40_17725 [Methylobacterium sp. Leaf399]
MSTFTPSRTEAKILTLACGRPDGQIVLPSPLKPVTAQRLMAKLLKHELIVSCDRDGQVSHHLTLAGYRSVGLEPPVAVSTHLASASKRQQVVDFLRRTEGANLSELIVLTGWLPHTTRAALSRLRSGGLTLVKSTREDGSTAYRIMTAEPDKLKPRRTPAKRKPADARGAVDASASAGATAV